MKGHRKDRETEKEDCPKCGARLGEKCKNYKGQGKAPCRLEIREPAKDDVRKPAEKSWTQLDWISEDLHK